MSSAPRRRSPRRAGPPARSRSRGTRRAARANVRTRDEMLAVGDKYLEMKAKGRVPTGKSAPMFWGTIASTAESKKDVALFEECVTQMKKIAAADPRYARQVDAMETRLKSMKDPKGAAPEKQAKRLGGG